MCILKHLLCGFTLFVSAFTMPTAFGAPITSLFLDTFQDSDSDPTNDVWEMTATVSADTDGISEYSIGVVGSHRAWLDAPRVESGLPPGSFFYFAGFSIVNWPGGGSFNGDGVLFARQDIEFAPSPGHIFYQVGVEAGGIPWPAPFENVNVPWDHPVLLGHGVGDWQAVDFDPASFPTISVFSDGAAETDSREVEAIEPGNITLLVTRHPIPEPTAATLLAFCMTALALRRLRQ